MHAQFGVVALAWPGRRTGVVMRPRALIVGAGFAGYHCARELERLLGPAQAILTLTSPVGYLRYREDG